MRSDWVMQRVLERCGLDRICSFVRLFVAVLLLAAYQASIADSQSDVRDSAHVTVRTGAPTGDAEAIAAEPGQRASFRDCELCPQMIRMASGKALIGGSERAAHPDGRADPARTVEFDSFAVGRFPITRKQYAYFAEQTGYSRESLNDPHKGCQVYRSEDKTWRFVRPDRAQRAYGRDDEGLPVSCVTWNDAQAYVRWLADETGRSYRLLSESEWEYVARSGSETAYVSGNCITTEYANFDGTLQERECDTGDYLGRPTPVGEYPPNAFGLHDLSGNVWEWVSIAGMETTTVLQKMARRG